MYVDLIFTLTKAIPIMSNVLPHITKLYEHGYDTLQRIPELQRVTIRVTVPFSKFNVDRPIIERVTITSKCYHMCYYIFFLSLAEFGDYLQHVTIYHTLPSNL